MTFEMGTILTGNISEVTWSIAMMRVYLAIDGFIKESIRGAFFYYWK